MEVCIIMVLLKIRQNNKERKAWGRLPPQLLGAQLGVSFALVQLLSPTLCDPVNCSTPGFPVLHSLPELAQTHVHWVGDAIQPSHPLSPTFPPALGLSQHQGLFQWVGRLASSGGQRIGASALVSVLPMNIQGWFPLGLTSLTSLLSKELWRAFSSTTIRKHQFFGTRSSLWSNS